MIGRGKIARIDNQIYDVYSPQEYNSLDRPEGSAIEVRGRIYPVTTNGNTDGVKVTSNYSKVYLPSGNEDKYTKEATNFVDFTNAASMKELLDKNSVASEVERAVLTSPDDITVCKRNESDSPLITILKDAIDKKHIDMHSYQSRFSPNFTNDMRIIDGDDITMKKAISFCQNLDLAMKISIEDKDQNVPNPIGTVLECYIVGGNKTNDETCK